MKKFAAITEKIALKDEEVTFSMENLTKGKFSMEIQCKINENQCISDSMSDLRSEPNFFVFETNFLCDGCDFFLNPVALWPHELQWYPGLLRSALRLVDTFDHIGYQRDTIDFHFWCKASDKLELKKIFTFFCFKEKSGRTLFTIKGSYTANFMVKIEFKVENKMYRLIRVKFVVPSMVQVGHQGFTSFSIGFP